MSAMLRHRRGGAAGPSGGRAPQRPRAESEDTNGASHSERPETSGIRGSGEQQLAIDYSLPAIRKPGDIFYDMVKRANDDLTMIMGGGGIRLRVGTMCSGTDGPIFSLEWVRQYAERLFPGLPLIEVLHLFSVEIVPFKQEFIRRNTEGVTIFCDVKDLKDEGVTKAPTATGSLAIIPTEIDLLIAGCSCKDFSALNNNKKAFGFDKYPSEKKYLQALAKEAADKKRGDERFRNLTSEEQAMVITLLDAVIEALNDPAQARAMGSSAETFYSMLGYVKNHKPKVLLLENVSGARWAETAYVWLAGLGYAAHYCIVDTKDYYLPQTRQRGYCIAVRRDVFGETADSVINIWETILKSLARKPSAPVSAWLVPSSHYLAVRARQGESAKSARSKDRDSAWGRSKVRHHRVRRDEGLGTRQPLTQWETYGAKPTYDQMDLITLRGLPNRAKDFIEITHLRYLTPPRTVFDSRYKPLIVDISQNIDRAGKSTISFGMSQCITASSMQYLTNQFRNLSGVDALSLQGLPVEQLHFAQESQEDLIDLAGNAMSTSVVGAASLAALIWIDKHRNKSGETPFAPCSGVTTNAYEINISVVAQEMKPEKNYSVFSRCNDLGALKDLVQRSRVYCFCGGAALYSSEKFKKCKICGTVRCVHCAGNPVHEYEQFTRPASSLPPAAVPYNMAAYFPSVLSGVIHLEPNLYGDRSTYTFVQFPALVDSLNQATFYYEETLVTEKITLTFSTHDDDKGENKLDFGFRVHCVMSEATMIWYVFLHMACRGAQQVRNDLNIGIEELERPFARAVVGWGANSLLPPAKSWQLQPFKDTRLELTFKKDEPEGTITIGIQCSDALSGFQPHVQQELASIKGTYKHHPNCLAAEDSLHFCSDTGLYFFKDPTDKWPAEWDTYVISRECGYLKLDEFREIIVKFPRKWSPASGSVPVSVRCQWIEPAAGVSQPALPLQLENHLDVPVNASNNIAAGHHDFYVLAQLCIDLPPTEDKQGLLAKLAHDSKSGTWQMIGKLNLPDLMEFIAPFNVKLAGTDFLRATYILESCAMERSQLRCCAPEMPQTIWMVKDDGSKEAHRLYKDMQDYEEGLKKVPKPFQILAKAQKKDEATSLEVQYTINPAVLIHRALCHLTHDGMRRSDPQDVVSAHTETQVTYVEHSKCRFDKFSDSLKSRQGRVPEDQWPKPNLKLQMSEWQSQSLAWMIDQERSPQPFVEREVEEHVVDDLSLRLVGIAERKVLRRGGVLADAPGYGKTAITFGLMAAQESFDLGESLVSRQERFDSRVHLKATLAVVPSHLVHQWASEALKFLYIEEDEVVVLNKFEDLREVQSKKQDLSKRLAAARLIIVSSDILESAAYHNNLAQYAGVPAPPTVESKKRGPDRLQLVSGRPFDEWHYQALPKAQKNIALAKGTWDKGTGKAADAEAEILEACRAEMAQQKELHDKVADDYQRDDTRIGRASKGRIVHADVAGRKLQAKELSAKGFVHVLEAFTFPRAIFDEFSYQDPITSTVFARVDAFCKWVLSATPPTRNLACICAMGKLLGLHIARPMLTRPGLPEITEGPPSLAQTPTEAQLTLDQIQTDVSVGERHLQGQRFLEQFSSAEEVNQAFLGNVRVHERVIVAPLGPVRHLEYIQMQNELQRVDMNADRLSEEARSIFPPTVDWASSKKGREVAANALVVSQTVENPSPATSAMGERPTYEDRRAFYKDSLNRAEANLRRVSDKAIWCLKRLYEARAKGKLTTRQQESDEDVDPSENSPQAPENISATHTIRDLLCLFAQILQNKPSPLCDNRAWQDLRLAFTTLENHELEIPDFFKPLDDQEPGNAEREKHTGNLIDKLYNVRKYTWDVFYRMDTGDDLAKKFEKFNEQEIKELVKEAGFEATDNRAQLLEALQQIAQDHSDETVQANVAALGQSVYKDTSVADLKALCRSLGLAQHGGDIRTDLIERLVRYDMDNLRPEDLANETYLRDKVAKARFPYVDEVVRRRGGVYTRLENEVVDILLVLDDAVTKFITASHQDYRAQRLLRPSKEYYCETCKQLRPVEDMVFVHGCGHTVCKMHSHLDKCGDTEVQSADSRGGCLWQLNGATTDLGSIMSDFRIFNSGDINALPGWQPREAVVSANTVDENHSPKTSMIVEAVKQTPENDKVLFFYQYDAQYKEASEALTKAGFQCEHWSGKERVVLPPSPDDAQPPAAVQPAAVQPAAVQPAAIQPAAVQPPQPAGRGMDMTPGDELYDNYDDYADGRKPDGQRDSGPAMAAAAPQHADDDDAGEPSGGGHPTAPMPQLDGVGDDPDDVDMPDAESGSEGSDKENGEDEVMDDAEPEDDTSAQNSANTAQIAATTSGASATASGTSTTTSGALTAVIRPRAPPEKLKRDEVQRLSDDELRATCQRYGIVDTGNLDKMRQMLLWLKTGRENLSAQDLIDQCIHRGIQPSGGKEEDKRQLSA
ncbi:hypothetical protein GGR56DRAFT_602340 [Xylariaceae sp. FL0804]|nr:hypothetical protein GGR56DRAFT_602340 [Xylariaceae sp. FL0804]